MIKQGTIKLLDEKCQTIQCSKYTSPGHRKEVIEKWKALYSKGFNKCFIQYDPNIDLASIGKNGENINRYDRPYSELGHNRSKEYAGLTKMAARSGGRISFDTRKEYNKPSHS